MNRGRDSGAVLIFTLWAAATLAAVGVAQATRLSLQSRYAARVQDQQQAWFFAESAVETVRVLLSEDDPAWDAPKETWARAPSQPMALATGSFLYQVRDEQSLLPLNGLPLEVLLRLPGFNEPSAQAVLSRRAEGKRVAHLGELRALAGYDAGALEELAALATVHGTGPVNLNTAGRAALEKLGLLGPFLDVVENFRTGTDGTAGTDDDGVFERADLEEIATKLLAGTGYLLTLEDTNLLNALLQGEKPMLGVASGWFRVTAEGRVTRSGVRTRVEAALDRSGTVGGWHES